MPRPYPDTVDGGDFLDATDTTDGVTATITVPKRALRVSIRSTKAITVSKTGTTQVGWPLAAEEALHNLPVGYLTDDGATGSFKINEGAAAGGTGTITLLWILGK